MAFQDYLELRTAVLEEVGRANLVDRFDRFVQMAEADMNRALRTRHQIVQTTVTFVDGYADIPGDMLAPIALYRADGFELGAVTMAQTGQIPLQRRDSYVVAGTELIGPSEGELVFQYYAQISSITQQAANATTAANISGGVAAGTYPSGSGSNWVLHQYPEAYLYGAMSKAERSLRNLDAAQTADALFKEQLGAITLDDARARYSRARVTIAGVTP